MCWNMERCRDWIILVVRLGCFVIPFTSSLRSNWCHLIPSSVLKHHWSTASILHASTLVTAQHWDSYWKIGRIQVLYNFSFVGLEMRDFQKWLSRLSQCINVWRRVVEQYVGHWASDLESLGKLFTHVPLFIKQCKLVLAVSGDALKLGM